MVRSSRAGFAAGIIWLLAVCAGFGVILEYQNTGGDTGTTPEIWPSGAQIQLDPTVDTLVMFVHPKCPCTRASVEELNRILAVAKGKVTVHLLFYKPAQFSNDWTHSELWQKASAIPGVTAMEDTDGSNAQLFGAATSGHVLLYDTSGRLLFSGGITGSRGHAGGNIGASTVLALLKDPSAERHQTRIFGCSLVGKCRPAMQGQGIVQ